MVDNYRRFILGALCTMLTATVFAAPAKMELHYLMFSMDKASAPIISKDSILFSYSGSPAIKMVCLAFEHEKYLKLHSYERNENNIFVLSVPIPSNMDQLRYRVIIDGLWTVDPNTHNYTDSRGVSVSHIAIPNESSAPHPGVRILSDNTFQFIYSGEPGSLVSLIGDFNRWDPYLTPMPESLVYPGVYLTTVPLPPNSQYYRYVVDGQEFVDPYNAHKALNGWGEAASILP